MSLPKRAFRHQADPVVDVVKDDDNTSKWSKKGRGKDFEHKSRRSDKHKSRHKPDNDIQMQDEQHEEEEPQQQQLAAVENHANNFVTEGAVGQFTKGNRLAPETQSYFKEIQVAMENLQQDDESYDENLLLMLNNVFEEMNDKEYRLAVNPRCSKILEFIFTKAHWSHLAQFFKKAQLFLFELMTDRCASHVIEAMAKRFSELEHDDAYEGAVSMRDLLIESYELLEHKWWDVACNTYGTHVLRTWIQQTKALGSDLSVSTCLVKSICSFSPADVSSICCDMYGSPLLQVLIDALVECHQADVVDGFMRKIAADFNRLAFDKFGSRLAEHILKNSANSVLRDILEKEICPNIAKYVSHKSANFVLQTALGNLRHVEQVNLCVSAVAELKQDLIASNRAGVLWNLAEACINLKSIDSQKLFVTSFIGKSDDFVRKLIESQNHMNLMLAQSLLQFTSHNLQIVKDFCNISDESLLTLAKSPTGSFVVQTFLKNASIAEKTKNKILDRLKGKFAPIALTPQGSRCVETCFEKASLTRKQAIAQELVTAENALKGTQFGRAVLTNLRIDQFKREPKVWSESQSKQSKAKELFADILDGGQEISSKSKSKKGKRKSSRVETEDGDEEPQKQPKKKKQRKSDE